ncbi:M15 family metallopeptidase [Microbacterium terricola]|uniref:M15 family metallopeptidase n=1 Tax=Microbacterium terricola TaxID=344163 RepID=UPI0021E929DC|nr:M15 family metallopeptidase [Microbacterium terricola]UYK39768.1 M15 family metallopeptidase [Microbacterium terricola]
MTESARRSVAPRHRRMRRGVRAARAAGLMVVGILLVGGSAAVTMALTGGPVEAGLQLTPWTTSTAAPVGPDLAQPATVRVLPAPRIEAAPQSGQAEPGADICEQPGVRDALDAGDDAAVIEAAGGAAAFRDAVAGGKADCISLGDPERIWLVVNKTRPYDPLDHRPADLTAVSGVRNLAGGFLRADAGTALTAMVTAARSVGELAMESGYRSFATQTATYAGQVSARGAEHADLVSARPGYSEHQSGLTLDVVACNGGCGTLDDLAGTPQGEWVAAHAWEYGWIVRYEADRTGITGYLPEPWHLRYIGTDLAAEYHEGGWHTLEEFFGLPAAPDYLG